jgi:hypothetical protein
VSQGLLSLALLLSLASTLAFARQPAAAPDLGRIWQVRDWNKPGWDYSGTWIRQGNSNLFKLEYLQKGATSVGKGEVVITVRGKEVTARLQLTNGQFYRGTIQKDGRTIIGKGNWCSPYADCGFQAVADWPVAATPVKDPGQIIGTVWRVHDFTIADYDYTGTWTRDPNSRSFRFDYKNKADGKPASGVVRLWSFDKDEFVFSHPFRAGYYRGKLQPDGKTVKGTADWCKPGKLCGWEAVIEK